MMMMMMTMMIVATMADNFFVSLRLLLSFSTFISGCNDHELSTFCSNMLQGDDDDGDDDDDDDDDVQINSLYPP
jgi:hypothetical protein